MTETDQIQEVVKQSASKIMEHVDSVQIFVTFHDGNKDLSKSFECGNGNFYARLGQVHEWMKMQERYAIQEAIRRNEKDLE